MSELTMSEASPARTGLPLRTWRDAVTPLSRASRRRWTVVYAVLLIVGGVSEAWPDALGLTDDTDGAMQFILIVALLVVFGMLRRGTRRLAAGDHPALDERDIEARDRAFRLAYPLLLLVMAITFLVLMLSLPEGSRVVSQSPDIVERETVSYLRDGVLMGLLLWGFLWAVYLPTGVLAWREPDSVTPDPAQVLPEAARDGLLAATLVLGLVLSGLGSGFGVVLFAGALATLGVLSRRKAGQPLVSVFTLWLVFVVIALIAAVLAVFTLEITGGGSSGGSSGR